MRGRSNRTVIIGSGGGFTHEAALPANNRAASRPKCSAKRKPGGKRLSLAL
jgi:hypothetical protein